MHPYTVQFRGGIDATVLNPLVLAALLVAAILLFALPRKFTVAPLILAAFLIPEGQQFYLAGIHLYVIRVLILVAFVRGITLQEAKTSHLAGGWNPIDTVVLLYVTVTATATLLRTPGTPALISQLGYIWDYGLGYLALRTLIRTKDDALLVVKCFAVLAVIFSITMLIERQTTVDVFALLKGVTDVPQWRNGKIRAHAVFQQPLTAGAFGATLLPLYFLLWRDRFGRWLAGIAVIAATIMVLTTQTSTADLVEAAAIFAIALWPLRRKMKLIRTGIVVAVIALTLAMKAPIWFLIDHINLTGASSGYQRAELINQCVIHFRSWWLIGTNDISGWGLDMWDVQNMYVSAAEFGGLAGLTLFILVLSRSFGRLGKARIRSKTKRQQWTVWLLGCAVFANLVAYFGVNYFDQVYLAWYAVLSMIPAITVPIIENSLLTRIKTTVHMSTPATKTHSVESRNPVVRPF